jgi:hypothetical protein
MATKEAPIHENVKQALMAASELDARLTMRPLRNTERVQENVAVECLLEKERSLGANLKFENIVSEVGGVYPKIMQDGDRTPAPDRAAWSTTCPPARALSTASWLSTRPHPPAPVGIPGRRYVRRPGPRVRLDR